MDWGFPEVCKQGAVVGKPGWDGMIPLAYWLRRPSPKESSLFSRSHRDAGHRALSSPMTVYKMICTSCIRVRGKVKQEMERNWKLWVLPAAKVSNHTWPCHGHSWKSWRHCLYAKTCCIHWREIKGDPSLLSYSMDLWWIKSSSRVPKRSLMVSFPIAEPSLFIPEQSPCVQTRSDPIAGVIANFQKGFCLPGLIICNCCNAVCSVRVPAAGTLLGIDVPQ